MNFRKDNSVFVRYRQPLCNARNTNTGNRSGGSAGLEETADRGLFVMQLV